MKIGNFDFKPLLVITKKKMISLKVLICVVLINRTRTIDKI